MIYTSSRQAQLTLCLRNALFTNVEEGRTLTAPFILCGGIGDEYVLLTLGETGFGEMARGIGFGEVAHALTLVDDVCSLYLGEVVCA